MRYSQTARSVLLLLLALICTCSAFAQFTGGGVFTLASDRVRYTVDWTGQQMRIVIERPVNVGGGNAPVAVSRTQAAIRRDASAAIVGALLRLPFDNSRTVAELVSSGEMSISNVTRIATKATSIDSSTDPSLGTATVTFLLDLPSDVIPEFTTLNEPLDLPVRIGWTPTAEYTGLLIYAPEPLPLFGTNRIEALSPTLLPQLWFLDEQEQELFPLLDRSMIDSDTITEFGPLLYHTNPQSIEVQRRIGENPLRVVAVGAFGVTATDPVLQLSDAERLLSTASNRQLLREGRIALIISPALP